MRNSPAQGVWLCFVLVVALGSDTWGQTAMPDCGSDTACLSLFDRAQQESKNGSLAEALRLYKLAYEVRADPRLLFSIARVLHKLDRNQEAVIYYKQFIESPVDDGEQKRKAEQYLEEAGQRATAAASTPRQPQATPPPQPMLLPSAASEGSKTAPLHAVARRPRWRFIAGGTAIGAGLLLTGFGGSALAAEGKCVDVTNAPAQTCDRVFTTNGVGGALVGTGGALVVGGIVLMAWPGK